MLIQLFLIHKVHVVLVDCTTLPNTCYRNSFTTENWWPPLQFQKMHRHIKVHVEKNGKQTRFLLKAWFLWRNSKRDGMIPSLFINVCVSIRKKGWYWARI